MGKICLVTRLKCFYGGSYWSRTSENPSEWSPTHRNDRRLGPYRLSKEQGKLARKYKKKIFHLHHLRNPLALWPLERTWKCHASSTLFSGTIKTTSRLSGGRSLSFISLIVVNYVWVGTRINWYLRKICYFFFYFTMNFELIFCSFFLIDTPVNISLFQIKRRHDNVVKKRFDWNVSAMLAS